MRNFVIAILLFFGCCEAALSEFMTGNDVLLKCQRINDDYVSNVGEAIDGGKCFGYLLGAYDMLVAHNPDIDNCTPTRLTVGQIILLYKTYVTGHPQELHKNGAKVLENAIKDGFSCR